MGIWTTNQKRPWCTAPSSHHDPCCRTINLAIEPTSQSVPDPYRLYLASPLSDDCTTCFHCLIGKVGSENAEYRSILHLGLVHFESRKVFADDHLRELLGASVSLAADCPLSKPPTIIYSSVSDQRGLLSFSSSESFLVHSSNVYVRASFSCPDNRNP